MVGALVVGVNIQTTDVISCSGHGPSDREHMGPAESCLPPVLGGQPYKRSLDCSMQQLDASKRVPFRPWNPPNDVDQSIVFFFDSEAAMEPPPKRRKAAQGLIEAEGDEDELFLEPEELNQRRDPTFQLQKGRALAVNKLKSRFEDIFAKYEKDFTGIGDEIDLRTGEVVVDNGHLESMRIAQDSDDAEEEDNDENEHVSGAEERILQGKGDVDSSAHAAFAPVRRDPWQVAGPSWPPLAVENTPRLSSMMSPDQQPFMSPFFSTPPFGTSTPMNLDPTWQAPELPISSFANYSSNAMGRQHGQQMRSITRKVARKSLPAPASTEADEEDVLLGVSGNVRKTKESPLIKKRFPMVSSPQEDPSLSQLIQEVIQENLPESSPTNRVEKTPRPKERPPRPKQDRSTNVTDASDKKRTRGRPKGRRRTPADQAKDPKTVENTTSSDVCPQEGETSQAEQSRTEHNELDAAEVSGRRSNRPLNQFLYVEIKTAKTKGEFFPVREDKDSPNAKDDMAPRAALNKPKRVEGGMDRNTMDPSFHFSDDDTLLPRKAKRRRQTEPFTTTAVATFIEDRSDPETHSGGQPLGRNTLDPSFVLSDDENMPSRKSRRKARLSEPVRSVETVPSTSFQFAPDMSHRIGADLLETCVKPKRIEQENPQKSRSPVMDTESAADQTTDTQAELHTQEAGHVPSTKASTSSLPIQGQQQKEPTTPQGPKSDNKNPHSTKNTSFISLLSDNEDEEDEISFNLADFTPSGHHRILVHRPFPNLASPSFSKITPTTTNPTSNKNKKKRTSLFPSSVNSSTASQKKTRTPDSAVTTGKIHKKRKHHQHNRLARSVVKVHHRHDTTTTKTTAERRSRLPSPTGSIVQTPGGTKRRCGEGDFRCERDFCFVCM